MESIHPRSLTKRLKNYGWEITFLLGRHSFKGYVKLQVGKHHLKQIHVLNRIGFHLESHRKYVNSASDHPNGIE